MKTMLILVLLGIIVESTVEILKSLYEEKKLNIDNLMSIVIGLVIAFTTNVNILDIIEVNNHPIIGLILTGILISRGSNYIHDLIDNINSVGK